MHSHYLARRDREGCRRHFGIDAPKSMGAVIRRQPHADAGDEAGPEREALPAMFGLAPRWAEDAQ